MLRCYWCFGNIFDDFQLDNAYAEPSKNKDISIQEYPLSLSLRDVYLENAKYSS